MAFSLSPAVTVNELDLTTTIPSVATSIGGIVGNFSWGPINERRLISTPDNLRKIFNDPNESNFDDWFNAENFLGYSNSLYVVRTAASDAINASNIRALTSAVENYQDFQTKLTTLEASTNTVIAKYAGVFGNTISLAYSNGAGFSNWAYKNEFEYTPEDANQEIALVVLVGGIVKERYLLSAIKTSKDYEGSSNYIVETVNRKSSYVYILEPFVERNAQDVSTLTNGTVELTNGADGGIPNDANYQLSVDLFKNASLFDVNFMIQTGSSVVGKYILENIAQVRRDCLAICSTSKDSVVGVSDSVAAQNSVTLRGTFGSSSYGFFVDNYKYQYDKYNDKYRWVSLAGDVAGLMARATDNGEAWTSPAGYTHGKIKNVTRLAYNPDKALRDLLYKNQVNPVITEGNDGTILLGDKTMQAKPSAFSFYNVRRLFIVIEKAIATASKYQLFDFNDEFSRINFRNMVVPYLRGVQARRGILDFRVKCDEQNNTAEIIDAGQFVADIYVKPNRTIQGMNLNFIATKTGVDFEELIAARSAQ